MNLWLSLKQLAFYVQMQATRRRKKETSDIYYFRPTLEITTRLGCKVACKACPQTLLCKKYKDDVHGDSISLMTLETFKKCIDKLPPKCQLVFSGFSEPFLNDACADMILYADAHGYGIDLYTTLVGITSASFDKIKKVPFNNLVLHIPDDMGSCNIEISEEYFSLLDSFLAARRADGSPLITGFSCHGYPLVDVTRHLKKYRFKKFSPDFLVNRAGNLNASNLFSQQVKTQLFCTRSYYLDHFVLLPDGRVVLCCMDFGLRHILGNLLEESYEDIVCGAEFMKLKHSILECKIDGSLCHNCTAAMSYDEVSFFKVFKDLCFRGI